MAAAVTLAEIGLYDPTPDPTIDRVVESVANGMAVPVALLSIVDVPNDRQFFKGMIGLGSPWREKQETPLSHSFCQYVVATDAPLVVQDARESELLRCNLAIQELGVIAYLGVPVSGPDGKSIGSLCAIDTKPRTWTLREADMLECLGNGLSAMIFSQAALLSAEHALRHHHPQVGIH